jgi:hypothetical protein
MENFRKEIELLIKCEEKDEEVLSMSCRNDYENLRKYCEFIRGDIRVVTESVVNDLYKMSDELVDKIDTYETQCIQAAVNKRQFKVI